VIWISIVLYYTAPLIHAIYLPVPVGGTPISISKYSFNSNSMDIAQKVKIK